LAVAPLDQIFGLPTGTIDTLVEPLGGTVYDAGDDIAGVEPVPGRFDPCHDEATRMGPGFGSIERLGVVAHHIRANKVTHRLSWRPEPGDVGNGRAGETGRAVRGRHFDREVIVLCVRWYLRFKLSLRDLVEMMAERGLSLAYDHHVMGPALHTGV
jgi:hypothetical protein